MGRPFIPPWVSSVLHIQTAKRQLERLQWKDLQDLPTIKRFLERVQENDGQFQYQNVTMASFNAGDDCVAEFYDHFKEPLSKAGLNGSLGALLDQWHHLLDYTKRYLEPSKTPYLFSLMNRVKTETRATLSENTLNNLVTIRAEDPELQDYYPTPAIESWLSTAHCQPNQKTRKYKSQGAAKKVEGFNRQFFNWREFKRGWGKQWKQRSRHRQRFKCINNRATVVHVNELE